MPTRHGEPTLDDIRRDFPGWACFPHCLPSADAWPSGASGRLYARKLGTLPPVVVRAGDQAGLCEQILQAEAR